MNSREDDKTEKMNPVSENAGVLLWQKKLLPWMVIMPTLLMFFFIYLATSQLNGYSKGINNYTSSDIDKVFFNAKDSSLRIPADIKKEEFIKLYMLAKMDEQLSNKRYSQGGVLLLSRLYTKYLGFFTGMILAIVGAVFIISKLSEQATQLETAAEAFKLSLVSGSPGIIFGVLGTILMLTTIVKQQEIDIRDTATYLNPSMFQSDKIIVTAPESKPSVDSMMQNSSPYKIKTGQ